MKFVNVVPAAWENIKSEDLSLKKRPYGHKNFECIFYILGPLYKSFGSVAHLALGT